MEEVDEADGSLLQLSWSIIMALLSWQRKKQPRAFAFSASCERKVSVPAPLE